MLGRDEELGRVLTLLGDQRLVTLVGPGGVGKTRLAVEVATELDTEFAQVAFVELAHVEDPSTIATELRRSLRVAGPGDVGDGWRHLDVASTLVVLDNCEHLLDEVAQLASSILATSRTTQLLVTSRAPLGVRGEIVVDLSPLPLASESGIAADSPAVELFVERTRAARSDIVIDDRAMTHVVELCRRLDGLPLAIEIVAAQVRAFPIERLAEMVAVDPAFAHHPWRDAEARHRSLLANVEWSRALLDAAENDALDAVSAFAPDLTLDAAEWMIDAPRPEAHRLVAALVQRSLLCYDATTGRYRLLSHVRETCLAALDSGRAQQLQRRRAQWCAALSGRWGRGAGEPETVAPELRAEASNLQDAAAWCVDHREHELLVDLVGPMAISWVHMGWRLDIEAWRAAAEEAFESRDELALNTMLAVAFALGWAGDLVAAIGQVERVDRLAGSIGASNAQANALVQHGHLESLVDPASPRVEQCFRQAMALYDENASVWGRGWSRFYLGRWFESTDADRAEALYDESLALVAGRDFPVLEGLILERRARLHLGRGRPNEALDLARRSRRLHNRAGYLEGEATSANCEGLVHLALGSHAAAATCHRAALRTGLTLRHEGIVLDSLVGLALVANRHGRPRVAARLASAAQRHDQPGAREPRRRFGAVPDELAAFLEDPGFARDRSAGRAADPVEILGWNIGPEPDAADRTDDRTDGQLVEPLSDRELTVLALLRGELTQREIANELVVAPSTVKSHVKAIYRKLGVSSRAEALDRAHELGIIG